MKPAGQQVKMGVARLAKAFCYITPKNGGVVVETSYNPGFVELIKRHIPQSSRRWDPANKTWWVGQEYAAQVRIDASTQFDNVVEI